MKIELVYMSSLSVQLTMKLDICRREANHGFRIQSAECLRDAGINEQALARNVILGGSRCESF